MGRIGCEFNSFLLVMEYVYHVPFCWYVFQSRIHIHRNEALCIKLSLSLGGMTPGEHFCEEFFGNVGKNAN